MTTPGVEALPQYTLKEGPYSSHSLLLAPASRGRPGPSRAGRRVRLRLSLRNPGKPRIRRHGHRSPWHRAATRNRVHSTPIWTTDCRRSPQSFDYIVCADVLEHLRDPLRMLRDCQARLAPGGTLILSLPNSGHWYFRWNVLLGRFPQHDRGLFDRTHLHFYTWDGWVELLHTRRLRDRIRRFRRGPRRPRPAALARLACGPGHGAAIVSNRPVCGSACSRTSSSSARAPGGRQ